LTNGTTNKNNMTLAPEIASPSPSPYPRLRSGTVRLDGRTRQAKRLKALIDTYADALGGWSNLDQVKRRQVEQAATLTMIAEMAQERFLQGSELATAEDLVRCVNAADRAVARIKPAAPKGPSLDEYLAGKRSEPCS
jgi:hypothetical protein